MRRTFLIAISAALLAASAQAQVIDAAKNFAGLDGIASRCIITTRYKYAKSMCDRLERHAQKIAEKNKIAYDFTGLILSIRGKKKKRDPVPPLKSDNLKNPLLLEFLIMGTKTPRVGALLSIRAYLEYKTAVAKDNPDSPPRSGKLVLWRSDIVGYGPARRLGPALVKAKAPDLREVMEAFAAAAKKPDQPKP